MPFFNSQPNSARPDNPTLDAQKIRKNREKRERQKQRVEEIENLLNELRTRVDALNQKTEKSGSAQAETAAAGVEELARQGRSPFTFLGSLRQNLAQINFFKTNRTPASSVAVGKSEPTRTAGKFELSGVPFWSSAARWLGELKANLGKRFATVQTQTSFEEIAQTEFETTPAARLRELEKVVDLKLLYAKLDQIYTGLGDVDKKEKAKLLSFSREYLTSLGVEEILDALEDDTGQGAALQSLAEDIRTAYRRKNKGSTLPVISPEQMLAGQRVVVEVAVRKLLQNPKSGVEPEAAAEMMARVTDDLKTKDAAWFTQIMVSGASATPNRAKVWAYLQSLSLVFPAETKKPALSLQEKVARQETLFLALQERLPLRDPNALTAARLLVTRLPETELWGYVNQNGEVDLQKLTNLVQEIHQTLAAGKARKQRQDGLFAKARAEKENKEEELRGFIQEDVTLAETDREESSELPDFLDPTNSRQFNELNLAADLSELEDLLTSAVPQATAADVETMFALATRWQDAAERGLSSAKQPSTSNRDSVSVGQNNLLPAGTEANFNETKRKNLENKIIRDIEQVTRYRLVEEVVAKEDLPDLAKDGELKYQIEEASSLMDFWTTPVETEAELVEEPPAQLRIDSVPLLPPLSTRTESNLEAVRQDVRSYQKLTPAEQVQVRAAILETIDPARSMSDLEVLALYDKLGNPVALEPVSSENWEIDETIIEDYPGLEVGESQEVFLQKQAIIDRALVEIEEDGFWLSRDADYNEAYQDMFYSEVVDYLNSLAEDRQFYEERENGELAVAVDELEIDGIERMVRDTVNNPRYAGYTRWLGKEFEMLVINESFRIPANLKNTAQAWRQGSVKGVLPDDLAQTIKLLIAAKRLRTKSIPLPEEFSGYAPHLKSLESVESSVGLEPSTGETGRELLALQKQIVNEAHELFLNQSLLLSGGAPAKRLNQRYEDALATQVVAYLNSYTNNLSALERDIEVGEVTAAITGLLEEVETRRFFEVLKGDLEISPKIREKYARRIAGAVRELGREYGVRFAPEIEQTLDNLRNGKLAAILVEELEILSQGWVALQRGRVPANLTSA